MLNQKFNTRILFVSIFCGILFSSTQVIAQSITFQDSQLREFMLNDATIDTPDGAVLVNSNGDNEIQLSEAELVTNLVVNATTSKSLIFYGDQGFFQPTSGISSLNGLEQFPNLIELTIEDGYLLTSYDYSGLQQVNRINIEGLNGFINIPTSDITPVFNNMPNLKTIEGRTRFEQFNFTNLPALDTLILGGFFTDFDPDLIPSLRYLSFPAISRLESINTSKFPNLEHLVIKDAQFDDYNYLTQIPNLKTLEYNGCGIEEIDLSQIATLESLNVNYCYDLISLEISDLTALESLTLERVEIEELNLNANPELKVISLDNVPINQLSFNQLPKIESITLRVMEINDLEIIDLANLESLTICQTDFSNLTLNNLPLLEKLTCVNGTLNTAELIDLPLLKELFLFGNQLEEINLTNLNTLTNVSLSHNQISNVNVENLINLKKLYLDGNLLEEVNITENILIETLSISGNNITQIDLTSNPEISDLLIYNNQISQINLSHLIHLKRLIASNNLITEIDLSSIDSLTNINLNQNQLSAIDLSQQSQLEFIDLTSNQLQAIDLSYNPILKGVSLENNVLTEINIENNPFVTNLRVSNNNLTDLNMKNGTEKTFFSFDNNPTLKHICVDQFQVQEIRDEVTELGYTMCSVSTYCSFNDGRYGISGIVRYDENLDGCNELDQAMPQYQQQIVNDQNTTQGYSFSALDGSFEIPLNEGSYSIFSTMMDTDLFTVDPSFYTAELNENQPMLVQDICIHPGEVTRHDLSISVLPLEDARPGFKTTYQVVVENLGNLTSSGVVTFAYNETLMELLSDDSEITVTGNMLSWNIENLHPFEQDLKTICFELNRPTDPIPLSGGEILTYNAQVDVIQDDWDLSNNVLNYEHIVVNSYDPNDKTCLEGNIIKPEMVGEYIHYRIRFENTGTASAINVVVKDDINTNYFDIQSLRVVDASHSMMHRIVGGRSVEFIFEDIFLPFTDELNDGYVIFKIKTHDWLSVGTIISNQAEIYFDFNFPIITNLEESEVNDLVDLDGDGFYNNYDCDDQNPNINPSAIEIIDNGIDDNCDGISLTSLQDADGDGFLEDVDCDDTSADINPDAVEIPNNDIDENCDGIALIIDNDMDGFNSDEDCDDASANINPDAIEIPNNNIDENCDGIVLVIDDDMDGFNSDEDCDDASANINPDAVEIPNNDIDENCDGIVLVIDDDMDGFNSDEDCDDTNPNIYPDAEEIPNNAIDEDCDGTDLLVSIDDLEESKISIYPILVNDYLNITSELKLDLKLLDANGQLVIDSKISRGDTPIDCNMLSSGIYIILLFDEQGVAKTERIVKL